jgi:RNA polymerase sigma factor (TIGR02999 family)
MQICLHILPRRFSANSLKKLSASDSIACRDGKSDNCSLPPMSRKKADRSNITEMLHQWTRGKTEVMNDLLPMIYDELHKRAKAYLRRERQNHTLQPTALVHEAYLKLVDQRDDNWQSREHFFAIAAQAMRRILVDHARNRHRLKRGGSNEDLPLEEALLAVADESNVDLIALDEAMAKLAEFDPQRERIVELRYFGGLTVDEAAKALGISRATAARDWQVAKAWLHREMTRRN